MSKLERAEDIIGVLMSMVLLEAVVIFILLFYIMVII